MDCLCKYFSIIMINNTYLYIVNRSIIAINSIGWWWRSNGWYIFQQNFFFLIHLLFFFIHIIFFFIFMMVSCFLLSDWIEEFEDDDDDDEEKEGWNGNVNKNQFSVENTIISYIHDIQTQIHTHWPIYMWVDINKWNYNYLPSSLSTQHNKDDKFCLMK